MQTLNLTNCFSLTALPDLSALTSLQTLILNYCESLTALPDLSALTSLKELILKNCSSLTALPDLSALTDLKMENLPDHLEPWKAGGFKAWSQDRLKESTPPEHLKASLEEAPRSTGCGCVIS